MVAGGAEDDEPRHDPDKAKRAGDVKGGPPAVMQGERGGQPHGDRRAERRAGIEDADGEGALPWREPFADGFDGGGKTAGFGQPQSETAEREGPFAIAKAV